MNFVSLLGRVRGQKDELTRYIEVNRPENVRNSADNLLVPCRHWTLLDGTALTTLKEGALVAIRGRIDSDDDDKSLFVIVESLTVIKD